MTVNQIIAEIIEEIGGDTTDLTLASKMLGFFKAGYRRIPAIARDRNFLGEATFTLPVGESLVTIGIPGFIRERQVWFQGDNLIHIPIYRAPSDQYWHKVITPNAPGKPFYYRIYSRTFQVDKKADTNLLIGMDYFKSVSDLVGTDTFEGDEQIIECAKDFCKMVYYRDYEEDNGKATDHERTGRDLAQKLEEAYEEQELGGYVDEKY